MEFLIDWDAIIEVGKGWVDFFAAGQLGQAINVLLYLVAMAIFGLTVYRIMGQRDKASAK